MSRTAARIVTSSARVSVCVRSLHNSKLSSFTQTDHHAKYRLLFFTFLSNYLCNFQISIYFRDTFSFSKLKFLHMFHKLPDSCMSHVTPLYHVTDKLTLKSLESCRELPWKRRELHVAWLRRSGEVITREFSCSAPVLSRNLLWSILLGLPTSGSLSVSIYCISTIIVSTSL